MTLMGDVRYAVRSLRRQPTFTAVAVLTLVLGIGANTAIFSVIKAVLLNQLPYRDPARLVVVSEQNPDGNICPMFTPRTTIERQTGSPTSSSGGDGGSSSSARKAFDDLFK
jgi:hypothetical protein